MPLPSGPFRFWDLCTGNHKLNKQKWQCSQYFNMDPTCDTYCLFFFVTFLLYFIVVKNDLSFEIWHNCNFIFCFWGNYGTNAKFHKNIIKWKFSFFFSFFSVGRVLYWCPQTCFLGRSIWKPCSYFLGLKGLSKTTLKSDLAFTRETALKFYD